MRRFLALALLVVSEIALGFQPLSGLYWNPEESGRGFTADFQQGVLVITMYVYDTAGNPIWYLAAGPMTAGNRDFSAVANEFGGGQCGGCPYSEPEVTGDSGQLQITWSDPSRASLTWQGTTTPIQRQDFGFGSPPESMLGEWTFVFRIVSEFADTYNFDTIGPTTGFEGGTGTFMDLDARAAGECFTSGTFGGQCLVTETNSSGERTSSYLYTQTLDRAYGNYVSPTTLSEYPILIGIQTADRNGATVRAFPLGDQSTEDGRAAEAAIYPPYRRRTARPEMEPILDRLDAAARHLKQHVP